MRPNRLPDYLATVVCGWPLVQAGTFSADGAKRPPTAEAAGERRVMLDRNLRERRRTRRGLRRIGHRHRRDRQHRRVVGDVLQGRRARLMPRKHHLHRVHVRDARVPREDRRLVLEPGEDHLFPTDRAGELDAETPGRGFQPSHERASVERAGRAGRRRRLLSEQRGREDQRGDDDEQQSFAAVPVARESAEAVNHRHHRRDEEQDEQHNSH